MDDIPLTQAKTFQKIILMQTAVAIATFRGVVLIVMVIVEGY